jgi:hypothetical protein
MNFRTKAKSMIGKTVQVTTTNGTFTGRMQSVGSDILIIHETRTRRRRIIRIAEIIALLLLFRL